MIGRDDAINRIQPHNNSIPIIVLLMLAYPLLSLIPQLLPSLLVQPALILFWAFLGLAAGRGVKNLPEQKTLGRIPLLAGVSYTVLYFMIGGLLAGLGYNTLGFTPTTIALNTAWLLSMAYGVEKARFYIVSRTSKPLMAILATALAFTLIQIPVYTLPEITGPADAAKAVGSRFNTFTILLLSGMLTVTSGPNAAVTFHATARLGTTLPPILPNLNWIQEVFVALVTLAIVYIAVSRILGAESKAGVGSVAAGTVLVALIWLSQGLLGYYMVVVTSGSMTPGIDVGDVAVVEEVKDPSLLRAGDIILYKNPEGRLVLHRIIDVYTGEDGQRLYITKGDANTQPDPEPVGYNMIVGEMLFTVPKAGYPTLIVKELILGGARP